jgi:hypothetical protein
MEFTLTLEEMGKWVILLWRVSTFISISITPLLTTVGFQAFDPIFFLHHCNVDRLLSLWAALNPSVWVSPGDAEDGTFILPPEAPVDVSTGA